MADINTAVNDNRKAGVRHQKKHNLKVDMTPMVDLGFLICLDTPSCLYGWLTAIDVTTKQIWQASRWGILRNEGEPNHRGRLSQLFRQGASDTPSTY